MGKDYMDELDAAARAGGAPLMRVVVTGAGAIGRHVAADLASADTRSR
jgi:phosphoglycerate dehydrogenase-like enzyme